MEPADQVLVRRCLGGDKRAFGTLVERYQKPIFNVALRMVGNPADAADIAQTVFVKAFEKLRGYDSRRKFYSWIYRIAINESIDVVGHRSRQEPLDESGPSSMPDPERAVGAEQMSRGIQQALMAITAEQRGVIVLRHFMDCSYREMSEILGIPEKTVKSRLFVARQQLRQRLGRLGIVSG